MNQKKQISKILIFEPDANGHKFHYVYHLANSLINEGKNIILITSYKNVNHKLLTKLNNEKFETIPIKQKDWFYKLFCNHRKWYIRQIFNYFYYKNLLNKFLNDSDIKKIFIPYLDNIIYGIGIFGDPFKRYQWSGVVMSLSTGYQECRIVINTRIRFQFLKNFLLIRALKLKKEIFCIQEPPVKFIKNYYPNLIKYFKYVPDPIFSWNNNKTEMNINLDLTKKYILVYGEISLRKGVEHLLNLFSKSRFNDDIILILAGKHRSDMTKLMSSLKIKKLVNLKKLIIINRFINYEEEEYLFRSSYIVWIAYKNFYLSSGVLYLAAQAGKPVVGSNQGIIHYKLEKYNIGISINLNNFTYEDLKELFENKDYYVSCSKNIAKLADSHNEKKFIKPITNSLINNNML